MMRWYHFVAYLLGGVVLANAVPHFVNGISGRAFPAPTGGLASPAGSVLWGLLNLALAYLLLCRVGRFELRDTRHALSVGLGALLISLNLARHFGAAYGGP
jgi:hypothetical protein